MLVDVSLHYQRLVDSGALFSYDFIEKKIRSAGAIASNNPASDLILGQWFRLARSFSHRNHNDKRKGWIHPFPTDTVQHVLNFQKEGGLYVSSLPSERFLQKMTGVFVEKEGSHKNFWVFLCDRVNKETREQTTLAEIFFMEDKNTLFGVVPETTGTADLPKEYKQVTAYRQNGPGTFVFI